MINGIGVVGWGVGGIEAEAGMLGQPVYFLTPDVVGVELKGKLHEGVTATDLVLTVTEMLRKEKVVGKFVEFFGEGTASLAVPDRATIANMAPEYGATMGFFPVDDATVDYLARHRPHRRRRSTRSRPTSRRRDCSASRAPARSTTRKALDARPRDDQAVARRTEAPAGPHRARASLEGASSTDALHASPVADERLRAGRARRASRKRDPTDQRDGVDASATATC